MTETPGPEPLTGETKDNSRLATRTSQLVMVAAVFDVDRTLVPVTTTERIFIRYLLRRRAIGPGAVLNTLLFMMKQFPRVSPFEAIRRQRAYLAGQPYDKMRRLARECFETDIKPRIAREGIKSIQEHKTQGHSIVLLSGSLDFLLQPLVEYLGADHLIAAHLEVVDGRLTGRIVGDYPYGDHKASLIRHFAAEHGLDFTQSFAYADHHTDHTLLRLFGNPVVINPRRKMLEIARREGWPTRDFL
jgi:HAD superfamily hydrolase (TIGR01490 family)